jgi:hypothetical protein
MAMLDAVETARASNGSVADWKDHRIALFERDDLGFRLASRPLLGENELTT